MHAHSRAQSLVPKSLKDEAEEVAKWCGYEKTTQICGICLKKEKQTSNNNNKKEKQQKTKKKKGGGGNGSPTRNGKKNW